MTVRSIARSIVRDVADSVVAQEGGGAVEIPDGAIAAWYADEYQSTPRKAIPNSLSAVALSQNLLRAPRRFFNSNEFWIKNGATVTDGDAESRVVLATGDSFLFAYPHPELPAGTYIMAITAKRHGGSDQQFRMSFLHAGVDSDPLTATSAYQRFTLTATVGAGTNGCLFVRTIDGSTAADIDIKDAALYAGSSDLGEPAFDGHLYLGDNHYDTRPACSAGVLDLTADGAYGFVQFESDLALSDCTVLAVASKTENGRTYSAILCEWNSQNDFAASFDLQKQAKATFGSGQNSYQDIAIAADDGYNPISAGWRFIAHTHDGAVAQMFANDTRLLRKTGLSPTLPVSLTNFIVGAFSSLTLTGGYKINSIVLYDRALTDEEVLQAYEALSARADESSLTIDTGGRYLVAVGDSLTADSTTPSYVHLFHANASPRCYGAVYAQSGGTLPNLVTNASTVDAVIPESGNGDDYVLSVLIGTNDLTASADVAGFLTDLAAYCDARRAAGWKVVLGTLLPTDRANFNSRRNTANATISTWAGVHADAIADFASDPDMGPDGAEADTDYYSDGVHPTLLGQQTMEVIYRAAVNGV